MSITLLRKAEPDKIRYRSPALVHLFLTTNN